MAKIRGLKPDFWTDKHIVRLSPLARLLYLGTWNYAADCGHLEDEPIELKMRILPADNCDVDELLSELASNGRITRADGVITIPRLAEHQHIDKRYFKACAACKAQGDHPVKPPSRAAKPDVTTPGPRSDHTVTTRGPHDEVNITDGDSDGDMRSREVVHASADAERESDFATFWDAYPKKRSKGQAVKAYRAARKKTTAEAILTGLRRQLPEWAGKDEQFIPYPATWLNGERWDDAASVTPIRANANGAIDPALLPPVENSWMRRPMK